MKIKDCKNCKHFYRMMATKDGYNPFPSCHLFEDKNLHPKVITKECFEKRKDSKND